MHYVFVYDMCVLLPERPEQDIRYPGAGVTGDREPPVWVLGARCRSSARTASVFLTTEHPSTPHSPRPLLLSAVRFKDEQAGKQTAKLLETTYRLAVLILGRELLLFFFNLLIPYQEGLNYHEHGVIIY